MARINGIQTSQANLFIRFIYFMAARWVRKLTGQKRLIEPIKIFAHHPRILMTMGQLDMGMDKSRAVEPRYKNLAMTLTARLIGCPF